MRRILIALAGMVLLSAAGLAQDASPDLKPTPAKAWPNPTGLVLLDVARAGDRLVAVGEQGVIVLSDDNGKSFRQAKAVPIDSALTAVTFTDAGHGWAVGHWGAIIATADGGETWQLQRVDSSVDQPLFSVAFKNAKEGWAVGLWSLLLHTDDGGKTWTADQLQPPPGSKKADRNLYKVFIDGAGSLYIAAELGSVVRSTDGGKSWVYLSTGYAGSFWTGLAASDGSLFVAGLRGNLYRSVDGGNSWMALDSGSKASISGLVETSGLLTGVALDGYTFVGNLRASSFAAHQLPDRATLTAVVTNKVGQLVITSKSGIIAQSEIQVANVADANPNVRR
jgi:photosystem II stability/assembly factor-like uncharacterized protein